MNDSTKFQRSGDPHTERWVLAVASVASLMVALDALVVSTALTTIGRQFAAPVEALEWTIDAYLLAFAVLQMTASALADRFGRRRIFIAGLAVFALASAGCALAPALGWLIAARTLQGAGAAMVMPPALALIGAAFPPENRMAALASYSTVTALSGVIGPLAGGAITQGLAWPWIFWLNVPIAGFAIVATLRAVPESSGPPTGVDVPGVLLVTSSAFGVVWGLVRGNIAGWSSAEVLGALAAGLVLVVLFVAWELRSHAPMLPMRLFANRTFAAGNAAMFFVYGTVVGTIFFLAQFLQVGLGYTPLIAGIFLLPYGVTILLAAPHVAAVAKRLGARPTIVTGALLQAAAMIWIAAIAQQHRDPLLLIAPLAIAGVGFALAISNVQASVLSAVAQADIGKASGTLSTLRQLGGAFGVAIGVAVFAHFGDRSTPQALTAGFVAAAFTVAGFALAAACAAAAYPAPARRAAPAASKTALG